MTSKPKKKGKTGMQGSYIGRKSKDSPSFRNTAGVCQNGQVQPNHFTPGNTFFVIAQGLKPWKRR